MSRAAARAHTRRQSYLSQSVSRFQYQPSTNASVCSAQFRSNFAISCDDFLLFQSVRRAAGKIAAAPYGQDAMKDHERKESFSELKYSATLVDCARYVYGFIDELTFRATKTYRKRHMNATLQMRRKIINCNFTSGRGNERAKKMVRAIQITHF